jgi:hypothetical protein
MADAFFDRIPQFLMLAASLSNFIGTNFDSTSCTNYTPTRQPRCVDHAAADQAPRPGRTWCRGAVLARNLLRYLDIEVTLSTAVAQRKQACIK